MRIGFTIVTIISALTFSVLTQPTLAATYVIDAALPAGGDREHSFIGGTWREDRNTCVLPPEPYPGLLIDAGDALTIESATNVRMPGFVSVRGYMHNKGSIDIIDPEGELWTISWPCCHGTILNDGVISVHRQSLTNHNKGQIINHGSIEVESGGRFFTVGYASFINHGTTTIHTGGYLSFQGGVVLNEGWIVNDEFFGMGGSFRPSLDNRGSFVNSSMFETYPGATVNNSGTITNGASAWIQNEVPFFNPGTVENEGNFENTGELMSSGTLGNGPAGTVTNLGTLVVSVTSHALVDSPAPGDAIWLLVRSAGGTYDTARPSQVASRDNGIAAPCFLP
jgi:hypothetical protein